jgi:hypothetical protein
MSDYWLDVLRLRPFWCRERWAAVAGLALLVLLYAIFAHH